MSSSLSVLTLNVWGLWLVSNKREQRIRYICDYLKTCKEDVVLLQEVWIDSDAQLLIRAGKAAGLQHCTHFRSGTFGSGLVTLSRHSIVRHAFWRYAAAGFAAALTSGDYYAGKGVGWVRIGTPLGEVDVFNTHLHANYCHTYKQPTPSVRSDAAPAAPQAAATTGSASDANALVGGSSIGNGNSSNSIKSIPAWPGLRVPDDDDAGVRISQLLELSELVNLIAFDCDSSTSSAGQQSESSGISSLPQKLVVLGGDLNCKPDTLEIDLLGLRLPQLKDAWASIQTHNSNGTSGNSKSADSSSSDTAVPNPEGYTCRAPGNTFQPRRQVAERIDYIWTNMDCQDAEVTLQMSPGGFSYSDHFAVRAVLKASGETAQTGAAVGSGQQGKGPLKLGGKVAASTAEAEQQQVQPGGSDMQHEQKLAIIASALLLLQDGMRATGADAGIMTALGGFTVTTLLYLGTGLPLVFPMLSLAGPMLSVTMVLAILCACFGTAWVLMGQVADKSQKRALQNSYRLLVVWMEQQGLLPRAA